MISAGWACEDEIVQLLLANTFFKDGVPSEDLNKSLAVKVLQIPVYMPLIFLKETYIEMQFKKERSFERSEIVFDMKKLQAVAHMHYSLVRMCQHVSVSN